MYIFTQLSILLCAASLVSAGCSVCPLGSGRCTAENGSGCRGGTVKYEYGFARNYCCREAGYEVVKCWSSCDG
ncbi:hypothetical protein PTNB85_03722 [Pyrenophora teres f. teres]|uniref:Uncharacterized protein n=1 Tax=Pyrenophora teres f. teres TaxID=97479 RepID=A0A776EIQ2_9PLEO|nr:hypothetical protein HRS9139_05724 [Pyrenophora teres f. teres]KAE8840323.1 hypothetical protein PTNB85_03722 [Pyrenophora teres f. teres]KAE8863822.1 hypothetical protein PTNB29_03786 [Pyrenophora teres f. teres]CAE7034156.1 hypothetical protein PTTW11_05358 [Pyrenophora teres f. teres]